MWISFIGLIVLAFLFISLAGKEDYSEVDEEELEMLEEEILLLYDEDDEDLS